jgi:hypothetical protein
MSSWRRIRSVTRAGYEPLFLVSASTDTSLGRDQSVTETWLLLFPDAGAAGLPFARTKLDPADAGERVLERVALAGRVLQPHVTCLAPPLSICEAAVRRKQ